MALADLIVRGPMPKTAKLSYKPKRKVRNYSRAPQNVNDILWFYEEPKGILVVYEIRNKKDGAYIRTDQFTIPWKMLKDSLNRHEPKSMPERKDK